MIERFLLFMWQEIGKSTFAVWVYIRCFWETTVVSSFAVVVLKKRRLHLNLQSLFLGNDGRIWICGRCFKETTVAFEFAVAVLGKRRLYLLLLMLFSWKRWRYRNWHLYFYKLGAAILIAHPVFSNLGELSHLLTLFSQTWESYHAKKLPLSYTESSSFSFLVSDLQI